MVSCAKKEPNPARTVRGLLKYSFLVNGIVDCVLTTYLSFPNLLLQKCFLLLCIDSYPYFPLSSLFLPPFKIQTCAMWAGSAVQIQ